MVILRVYRYPPTVPEIVRSAQPLKIRYETGCVTCRGGWVKCRRARTEGQAKYELRRRAWRYTREHLWQCPVCRIIRLDGDYHHLHKRFRQRVANAEFRERWQREKPWAYTGLSQAQRQAIATKLINEDSSK